MPLFETESLVIKTYNLAEADKIVVLLTRDHGVVRGVAKGAKRLKSRFGSGLEPFSVVNAEYFQKDNQELVSLQRIELVRSNFGAASDPDFLRGFTYLSELVVDLFPPHDPNETLYRMANACLSSATGPEAASFNAIAVYFEFWILKLAGVLPDWSACNECSRMLDDEESTRLLSDSHLVCIKCRRAASLPEVSASVRALTESIRRRSPSDFSSIAVGREDELDQLSGVARKLITQALGRDLRIVRASLS